MITCLIVDDENRFVEVIENYVSKFPRLQLIGTAASVAEATELILELQPQLIFLDIELTDGTSFEILSNFPNRNFQVIFTTGHNDYAIKAIKHSAIDYLLKPVQEDEFTEAVEKAMQLDGNKSNAQKLELMLSNITKNEFSKIAIPSIDSFEFINKNNIIYCKADVSYTTIYLENKKIVSTNNIKKIEDILTESNFFRLHKSFIVNIDKIQKVLKTEGGSVIMPNDVQIPIARRRKDEFMKMLGI
ncbi:MAG: LytR/AlgR family response regulator transcription factor [Chitinophagales bacterium]